MRFLWMVCLVGISLLIGGGMAEANGPATPKAAALIPNALLHTLPRYPLASAGTPVISDDGRYILYEYRYWREHDSFPTLRYYDTQTGTLVDLFSASDAVPYMEGAMPQLSPDGRFALFGGCYSDLPDTPIPPCPHLYRYDHATDETLSVAVSTAGAIANAPSAHPSLSADGSLIVFASGATNLVANDTNGKADIFLRDVAAGTTIRVGDGVNGDEPNGDAYRPSITDDGQFIVLESDATNLVANDTNAICIIGATERGMTCRDVFIYEVATATLERVSLATGGVEGNGTSFQASISNDGNLITFVSSSNNLVAGDTNGNAESCYSSRNDTNYCYDLFLHNRITRETRRLSLDNEGNEINGSSQSGVISPDGTVVGFATDAPEGVGNCSSCWGILRLDLATSQWETLETVSYPLVGELPKLSITTQGNQIGFTGLSYTSQTCDPNSGSYYCYEALVWDATNAAYLTPLPACSGYPRPSRSSLYPTGGEHKIYLSLTLVRIACRDGLP